MQAKLVGSIEWSRLAFSTVGSCLFTAATLLTTSAVAPGRPPAPIEAARGPTVSTTPAQAAEIERLSVHIAQTWRMPPATAHRIVNAAYLQARQQQISPTLILAVVAQESSFRPDARSHYGAQGLMQVVARHHPEKLRGLQRDALLRPETNIAVGTQVLTEYLQRHNGRLDPALRKYSGNATAYPQKVRTFWIHLEQVRRTEPLRI